MSIAVRAALPRLRMLHYLFARSGSNIVAHCLDFDIAASAGDRPEAERRLDVLVKNYIECALNSGNYPMLTTSAPEPFWTSFKNGERVEPTNPTLKIRVPDVMPTAPLESQIPVLAYQSLAS